MITFRRLLLVVIVVGLSGPAPGADEPKKKEENQDKLMARMVYYRGDVQGVGFRATTADIAQNYTVTGWVKNLSDGRVQLLVEGPPQAVDDFLKAVRDKWKNHIKEVKIEEQTVSGKYKRFTIER